MSGHQAAEEEAQMQVAEVNRLRELHADMQASHAQQVRHHLHAESCYCKLPLSMAQSV